MVQDLVSIITPCYNGGKFIAETIESVLSQTYPNWEMLIIDDGSEDNSRQIIESYAVREKRIQYYYQEIMAYIVLMGNTLHYLMRMIYGFLRFWKNRLLL